MAREKSVPGTPTPTPPNRHELVPEHQVAYDQFWKDRGQILRSDLSVLFPATSKTLLDNTFLLAWLSQHAHSEWTETHLYIRDFIQGAQAIVNLPLVKNSLLGPHSGWPCITSCSVRINLLCVHKLAAYLASGVSRLEHLRGVYVACKAMKTTAYQNAMTLAKRTMGKSVQRLGQKGQEAHEQAHEERVEAQKTVPVAQHQRKRKAATVAQGARARAPGRPCKSQELVGEAETSVHEQDPTTFSKEEVLTKARGDGKSFFYDWVKLPGVAVFCCAGDCKGELEKCTAVLVKFVKRTRRMSKGGHAFEFDQLKRFHVECAPKGARKATTLLHPFLFSSAPSEACLTDATDAYQRLPG